MFLTILKVLVAAINFKRGPTVSQPAPQPEPAKPEPVKPEQPKPMRKVVVTRGPSTDMGTHSELTTEGFSCVVGEPPWVDMDGNGKRDPRVSCIRPWKGICLYTKSPSRKNKDGTPEWSYELQNAPDASGVRIHLGNYSGNVLKKFLSDSEACLLLGKTVADVLITEARREKSGTTLKSQRGVTDSRNTVAAFEKHMNYEPFELEIRNRPAEDAA